MTAPLWVVLEMGLSADKAGHTAQIPSQDAPVSHPQRQEVGGWEGDMESVLNRARASLWRDAGW